MMPLSDLNQEEKSFYSLFDYLLRYYSVYSYFFVPFCDGCFWSKSFFYFTRHRKNYSKIKKNRFFRRSWNPLTPSCPVYKGSRTALKRVKRSKRIKDKIPLYQNEFRILFEAKKYCLFYFLSTWNDIYYNFFRNQFKNYQASYILYIRKLYVIYNNTYEYSKRLFKERFAGRLYIYNCQTLKWLL